MAQFALATSLAALALAGLSSLHGQPAHPSAPQTADSAIEYTTLALVHHERGQKNEARDALEIALRVDPDYAPALELMEIYEYRGPQAK